MLSRRAEVCFPKECFVFYAVVNVELLVLLGATNPLASAPGTIRGDYAIVSGQISHSNKIS